MIAPKLSVLTPQLTPIYSELTPKMRLDLCDCRQIPLGELTAEQVDEQNIELRDAKGTVILISRSPHKKTQVTF